MKALEYVIRVKDFASGVVDRVRGAFGRLAAGVGSLLRGLTSLPSLLAGGAFGAAIGRALKGAADYERAARLLGSALNRQGILSRGARIELEKFASEIQRTTTVGDDAALSAMTLGLNMGLQAKTIREATKAAIGLSAAYGMDLEAAMTLIARAQAGQTETLARYGIILSDTLTPQQKYAELIRRGTLAMSAESEAADTLGGRFTRLKNAVGDFFKNVGFAIDRVFNLRGHIDNLRERIEKFLENVENNGALDRWVARVKTAVEDAAGAFRIVFQGTPEQRGQLFGKLGEILATAFSMAAVGAVKLMIEMAPRIGMAMWRGFRDMIVAGGGAIAKLVGEDPVRERAENYRELFVQDKEYLANWKMAGTSTTLALARKRIAYWKDRYGVDLENDNPTADTFMAAAEREMGMTASPEGFVDRAKAQMEQFFKDLHEIVRASGLAPNFTAPPVPEKPLPYAGYGPPMPGDVAGSFAQAAVAEAIRVAKGVLSAPVAPRSQKEIDDEASRKADLQSNWAEYRLSKLPAGAQLAAVNASARDILGRSAKAGGAMSDADSRQLLELSKRRDALQKDVEKKAAPGGGLESLSMAQFFMGRASGGAGRAVTSMFRTAAPIAFGQNMLKSAFGAGPHQGFAARLSGGDPAADTAENTADAVRLLKIIAENSKGLE